jgi:hypothetical protein
MRELPATISEFVELHENRDRRQIVRAADLSSIRISRAIAYLSLIAK